MELWTSRHEILPGVGPAGMQKLREARVLVVGAGGLGCPAALYLARSGVGTLGIMDADTVDESNLNRQVLHRRADIGRLKVDSAADALRGVSPDLQVTIWAGRLTENNALAIFSAYDFIIDGTDNSSSKFLINDAAYFAGKPFSHAGAVRFEGQTMTVVPGKSACLRCLFETPPPDVIGNCSSEGILGPVTGIIGLIQATEALRSLLGMGDPPGGHMLIFDALSMGFRKVTLRPNPDCPLCGTHPTIHELREEGVRQCQSSSGTDGIIVTFATNQLVLLAERCLKRAGLLVESRVTPRQLSHECGICLEVANSTFAEIQKHLSACEIKPIRHESAQKLY